MTLASLFQFQFIQLAKLLVAIRTTTSEHCNLVLGPQHYSYSTREGLQLSFTNLHSHVPAIALDHCLLDSAYCRSRITQRQLDF